MDTSTSAPFAEEPDFPAPVSLVRELLKTIPGIRGPFPMKQEVRDKDYSLVKVLNMAIPRGTTYSVKKTYQGLSVSIAAYAFTLLTKHESTSLVCGLRSLGEQPTTTSVPTGVEEETTLYRDGILVFGTRGLLIGAYDGDTSTYLIELACSTEENLESINRLWEETLEGANFYRGKCLQLRRNCITFLPIPKVTFKDVVLQEDKLQNFIKNTLHFYETRVPHIPRRSVILYGPPGGGKTTLVSAAMNAVCEKGIGTIVVAGDAFTSRFGPEDLVDFVNRFLCPAMIVFEDFDLIAYDRASGNASLIGDVLALLDGVDKRGTGLVIIATTNRFDCLDEAAVRPCRFDRRIEINYPEEKELRMMWDIMGGPGEFPEQLLNKEDVSGAHIREIAKSHTLFPDAPIDQLVEEVLSSFFVSTSQEVGFAKKRFQGGRGPQECPPERGPAKQPIGKNNLIGPR